MFDQSTSSVALFTQGRPIHRSATRFPVSPEVRVVGTLVRTQVASAKSPQHTLLACSCKHQTAMPSAASVCLHRHRIPTHWRSPAQAETNRKRKKTPSTRTHHCCTRCLSCSFVPCDPTYSSTRSLPNETPNTYRKRRSTSREGEREVTSLTRTKSGN